MTVRQLNSYLDFACAAGTAAFAGFTAVNHESTNWGFFYVQLRVCLRGLDLM